MLILTSMDKVFPISNSYKFLLKMSHTENLTIMFTDIADYSESVAKMSRKESEEMLKAHDKILHRILKQYKGKWIKSIGDSFLVVFRSPTDAALCGMAMHDALWELMKANEDVNKNIRIRVALNLGEVRLTRNDVFGEAVNIAARLEGITPADNIYLTESVYLSMNKAEVLAVKEGSEKFKGSPEEIIYYKIPRSVSRRVVADETEEDVEYFNYPFGGAHLKAQLPDKDSNLELISSVLTGGNVGIFSKVAMGIGALSLAGVVAFFLLRSDVTNEAIVEQDIDKVIIEEPNNEVSKLPPLNLPPSEKSNAETASIEIDGDVFEATEKVDETVEEVIELPKEIPVPLAGKNITAEVIKFMDDDDFSGLQTLADEYAQTFSDDPYLSIVQGHLQSNSSNYRDAIQSYEKGLEGEPSLAANEYLAVYLVALLDHQPTRTKALIKDNLSKEIIDQLSIRTGERGIQSRHYAVKLLVDSDNADKIDSIGMNIWDLRELKKCKERKVAVVELRRLKDPRALPALKEVIGGKFVEKIRMSCLTNEAKAAISEIEGS